MKHSKNHPWSLIGIPDHQGVENVGGRVGAAHGPKQFRKQFKFSGLSEVFSSLQDAGDLEPESPIEKSHAQAIRKISEAHKKTGLSVVIGGGHDHGYTHLAGIKDALGQKTIGCINLDAHLDVRKPAPKITSGSPFYLALENKIIQPEHFIEFGIQRHCNGTPLWDYIQSKKVDVVLWDDLRNGKAVSEFKKVFKKLAEAVDEVVVSFDLDCVAQAFAPGVSAPQAEGFTPEEIFQILEFAAETKNCHSLGIFELNPLHDVEEMTARLAAQSVVKFIGKKLKLY